MPTQIEKRLENLSEFLSQRLWDDENMVFRGAANSSFQLVPSVGRCKAVDEKSHADYEKTVFEKFKQRAVRYLPNEPRTDVEWLFLAQHYGIPTRLLDWTQNPLVALYFACDGLPDSEGAVYKIVLTRWYHNFDNPFAITEVGGLQPRHTDIRYINQAGVFTIHPKPTQPLEWGSIGKYILSKKVKSEIRWQLRKIGIHASFIYPSLESIARDIINEYDVILGGNFIRGSGNPFEF